VNLSLECRKPGAALHGLVFLAALGVVLVAFPSLTWPWFLAIPLSIYACVALSFPGMRRAMPAPALGRIGGLPLAFAVLISAGTSIVLVAFQALAHPDMSNLTEHVPSSWYGNVVLAWPGFSLVNAALEELVFRYVLWEIVALEWSNAMALCATSVIFGFIHMHGYPSGPAGAILAGIYGLCLGTLRWWTGGLGLAFACHVCADATIFGILWGFVGV
jgi:membrane protease YdiL (CAAX protease family)